MKTTFLLMFLCLLLTPLGVIAQDTGEASADASVTLTEEERESADEVFGRAAGSVEERLENAIEELNAVRAQAAEETIPLSRKLRELENELRDVRAEFQSTTRILDSRTLDLTNLRGEIEKRKGEATYLSNLLSEYIRNFESRLHIAELQLYEEPLDTAKLALENNALSEGEVYEAQAQLLLVALERLQETAGGTRFQGTAVDPGGILQRGDFTLLGPVAIFASEDGEAVGTAEQRLGSLEPTVMTFDDPEDTQAAIAAARGEAGAMLPLDPTLGNAHAIEETEETFAEHVAKGGPVMIPIFTLAGLAFLVAMFKWISMLFIRTPSQRRIRDLMDAVGSHDLEAVKKKLKPVKKPASNFATGWISGAFIGLILAAAFHFSLQFVMVADYLPGLATSAAEPDSFVRFLIMGAIAGAVLEFFLRLLFGYSPVGRMLSAGVEHLEYPPELIEEVMYEQMLSTRLKLDRFLPFIAISAAAAPLLGLLGTVTGIINTFKLITVFGSGDVKTLSSGISEALVTTEFGLIVAIPSLLIHALLARKARGVINQMEKAGVALVNQVAKTPYSVSEVFKAKKNGKAPKVAVDDEEKSERPEEVAVVGAVAPAEQSQDAKPATHEVS